MNASDLVTAALEKRPSDFFKIFNELALERAEALVGEMKDDIARGLLTSTESTDEEFDEEIESFLEYISTLTEEEAEEELEQLDELSKQTLASYINRAARDSNVDSAQAGSWHRAQKDTKVDQRLKGIRRATDQLTREEVEPIDETIKIGTKVNMHAPGQSYHGKQGTIGEIRHGLFKGAPKTYTVDYDNGKSIQLSKKSVKLAKEETLNLGGYQPVPGAEKDFVSKHKVEKFGDRAGNGDAVYKGTTKPAKYPKADKGGTVASTE